MSDTPWPGQPFKIDVDDTLLDDLRDRLRRTRFPEQQAGDDWATGTPLEYAKRLRDHWLDRFDWRHWERRINALEQRIIEIDGVALHVVLERGSGPNPLPILMTNGWPGSFLEFIDVVDRLAHPERFGGDARNAFTVVIPSLPGYGFSPPPPRPLSPDEIARLWASLMRNLGLHPYVAYGSDWGSLITARLALLFDERLQGFLITSTGMQPSLSPNTPPPTEEEGDWLGGLGARLAPENGYQRIQGTKPQTLAYGHADSPMALACWIIEKFHGWTVPGEACDPPFSMDELLANVMLYWINGALAPMWLYGFLDRLEAVPENRRVRAPAGFLFSPKDLLPPPPRPWLERMYDVRHVRVTAEIGHFPGLDSPVLLSDELHGFLGQFR